MGINFRNVRFYRAYGSCDQIPPSTLPEVAFIGRSNVGKSSLINRLFDNKRLAKVSSSPGKTATVNFYDAKDVYFVDLPGYGYARTSKTERERLADLIEGYLHMPRRFALVCTLVDIRHDVMKSDLETISVLASIGLPFAVLLTKCDKFGPVKGQQQAQALMDQMNLPENTPCIMTSSEKGTGIEDLQALIERCCAKVR